MIERLVEELLARRRVAQPPVPVEKLAEELGLDVRLQDFHKRELSGVLVRTDGRTVVGVNSAHSRTRRRFTIAHEIGHFLLHEGDRVFIDRNYAVNRRDTASSLGTHIEEVEANTFASLLLIPERFLREDLRGDEIDIEEDLGASAKVRKLARKYSVSPQAMSFRLINHLS